MIEIESIDEAKKNTYSRFSDSGPLQIRDWNEFLRMSRNNFKESWQKPFVHEEKLSDFNQIKALGFGSFATVVLIRHKKNDDYYAMKVIEKEKLVRFNQIDHTKNEKFILQSINFPLSVYLKYFFKDNSFIYMVLPFIPGGELFGYLKKRGSFEEDEARFYTSQIVLALEYLHYLNLVYRDLKPENILIDHTGYLKLTDFGFCKYLAKDRTYTLCGTPEYLAPEVIQSKGYGKSVDWWAVGILVYDLVAGNPPFYANQPMRIYEKIIDLRYKIPSSFSYDLKDLVKNILQLDLSKRYGNMKNGINDIKGHSWFKRVDWMGLLNRTVPPRHQPKYRKSGDTGNFDDIPWRKPKIAAEDKYADEFADF